MNGALRPRFMLTHCSIQVTDLRRGGRDCNRNLGRIQGLRFSELTKRQGEAVEHRSSIRPESFGGVSKIPRLMRFPKKLYLEGFHLESSGVTFPITKRLDEYP